MIVPRVRTPIPCADLPAAMDDGHHRARGCGLSLDAYAIACAQAELEHGRRVVGAADVTAHPDVTALRGVEVIWAVWGFNVGNHDAATADRADPTVRIFQTVPENEIGAVGAYQAQHWRRASEDAGAGCEDFWRCLYLLFSDAYEALRAGDPEGFVHQLKIRGYFTATEASYDRLEEPLVAAWRRRVAEAMG